MKLLPLFAAVASSLYAQGQEATKPIDWGPIFTNAVSDKKQDQDWSREELTGTIMPRLCSESPELAARDVGELPSRLDSPNPRFRLQASATLYVLSWCRKDSATALAATFPELQKHIEDSTIRIRYNSVNTLSFLMPSIPDPQLRVLVDLVKGKDEGLAAAAMAGVGRMADSSTEASDTLENVLRQSKSPSLRIAGIKAVAAAHLVNKRFMAVMGDLLESDDREIVKATLEAIRQMGPAALELTREQIGDVASRMESTDLGNLAEELLKPKEQNVQ